MTCVIILTYIQTHSSQVKTKERALKMMVDEPDARQVRNKRETIVRLLERIESNSVSSARFHWARYLILSPACLSFTDQISSNSICMFPSSVFVSAYRLRACFIFFSKYDQVLTSEFQN